MKHTYQKRRIKSYLLVFRPRIYHIVENKLGLFACVVVSTPVFKAGVHGFDSRESPNIQLRGLSHKQRQKVYVYIFKCLPESHVVCCLPEPAVLLRLGVVQPAVRRVAAGGLLLRATHRLGDGQQEQRPGGQQGTHANPIICPFLRLSCIDC